MSLSKERIKWIDCVKGIAIILVIIGHSISISLVRGLIFSFHMPLFFILSSMTFKCSKDINEYKIKTKKSFEHLIFPVIIICLIKMFLQTNMLFTKEWFITNSFVLLLSSGAGVICPFLDEVRYVAMGMPWFLVVLFLARLVYDYMHLHTSSKKWLFILSILVSTVGVWISKFLWLPFSFDIVLSIMFFMYIGSNVKKDRSFQRLNFWCGVFLSGWLITFFIIFYFTKSYLELAARQYPLFPLCYITAVLGTFFLFCLSMKISDTCEYLCYFGKYSIYIFCIHALDEYWSCLYNITNSEFLNCVLRVLIDLFIFELVMKIREKVKV